MNKNNNYTGLIDGIIYCKEEEEKLITKEERKNKNIKSDVIIAPNLND